MLNHFLPLLLLIAHFTQGIAQDQITTTDGAVIDCKINSIDSSGISFITYYSDVPTTSYGKIETIKSFKYKHKVYIVSELSKEELNNLIRKPSPAIEANKPEQDGSIKIDLILPSIALEKKVGNDKTILFSFQPGFAWRQVNDEPAETYIIPQGRLAYRSYYNFDRRRAKGKSTNKFSGDFFSMSVTGTGATEINYGFITLAATAGIQRVWSNIIHFSIEIGPGFIISNRKVTNPIAIYADLRLGIAL